MRPVLARPAPRRGPAARGPPEGGDFLCYNKCYGTSVGNPCDIDADCASDNCYQSCCYGNGPGDPCDIDADCDSDNCYDNVCQ